MVGEQYLDRLSEAEWARKMRVEEGWGTYTRERGEAAEERLPFSRLRSRSAGRR